MAKQRAQNNVEKADSNPPVRVRLSKPRVAFDPEKRVYVEQKPNSIITVSKGNADKLVQKHGAKIVN